MLYYVLVFLLTAIVTVALGIYGFSGTAALMETAALTEKILLGVFLLFVILSLVGGRRLEA